MKNNKKPCPECKGYGEGEEGGYPTTCHNCGGSGKVTKGGKADTENKN